MKRRIVTTVWIGLGCGMLSAAVAASDPKPATESQDVVVQGKSLRDLRADVKNTERRFRSLYDRLNQDIEQQVSCQDDAATGTRFKKRTCTTRAAQNAAAEAAQGYAATAQLDAAVSTQTSRGAESDSAGPNVPASKVTERYVADLHSVDPNDPQEAYRRNLEKLMNENPELRKRFEEYAQAMARLQEAENKKKRAEN
jgi:hypothetical protein